VGAVTHVLINDPSTGYEIFIENILYQYGGAAIVRKNGQYHSFRFDIAFSQGYSQKLYKSSPHHRFSPQIVACYIFQSY
jgi:hypothetical protein